MSRRKFCAALAAFLLAPGAFAPATARAAGRPLRIGLTPVFLDEQAAFLEAWRAYLERRLGQPVEFAQRGSYREIVDLLGREKLDAAWLCGYPYVRYERALKLVAVPLYQGKPLYRSYLIAPAAAASISGLADLRGKVFAYSDPLSNSGFLYPQYRLAQMGERAEAFFSRTFFTWTHRKVVEAVAVGMAQGGAVDGYIWDTLARIRPELTEKTRVVEMSPAFGFPPLVARASLLDGEVAALRRVLLSMGENDEGRSLLGQLNLDGFTAGDRALYDEIGRMARVVGGSL